METSSQLLNQHLLWRAGFGPAAEQVARLNQYTPGQYYQALEKTSAAGPRYLNVVSESLSAMYNRYMDPQQRSIMTADERRQLQRQQQAAVRDLNILWLKEMIATSAQLREKMAFFWHGHFACRNNNIYYNQLLLHAIRTNATGNFGDLLRAVSKSAAMLYFLNNQQNKKGHPNENFAREVMELFTLGRGNYTEKDIKEAARAFTGWAANNSGEFVFRKNQHDVGVKTFLGKTGNFNGDDVLDIILDRPETAIFITKKIYRFFVNDKEDAGVVQQLARKFSNSGYDIAKLMRDIFLSAWFYEPKNIGVIIKSPVELLAGIQRIVPMRLDNDNAMLNLQRILGQQLLYPPNVAGWPGGTNWIDSSTLMMRLRLPQLFTDKDVLNVAPKQDDDVQMGMKAANAAGLKPRRGAGFINAVMDWPAYTKQFETVKRENLLDNIAGCLLQSNPNHIQSGFDKYIDASGRDNFIKSATIQIMSTPEYQMC